MDVVYILGRESKWQDREILYSVRSVEKHLKNFRHIFIVGHKPKFFNDKIIEIPHESFYWNKARNIMSKILRAATDRRVSSDFILLNDDYFLLKDLDPKQYPYYHKGELSESIRINSHNLDYLSHLEPTQTILKQKSLPTKNFDVHYPIVYNKAKFKRVCSKYSWNIPSGYIMKSIYCNTLNILGEQIKDCKINHPHMNWNKITESLHCLSIGDRSINNSLINFLNNLFPNPSKYETNYVN